MVDIAQSILNVVVFPGLIFSSIVGLFLCWIDRKVAARIQSRIGPPWHQCYTDIFKLMGKTMIVPKGSRKAGFLAAPLIGLAGATLVSTLIWKVNLNPSGTFFGDLIVVIYLLILPSLALIIGGSASRNPFGTLGVAREMKMILAYELPYLIAIFTVIFKVNSILLGDILAYQSTYGVMMENISCIIAFLVMMVCIQAKLGYLPFDIPEAETEIIGGVIAEYSGVALAIFKVTNAIMLLVLPLFLVTLFMGGIRHTVGGIITAAASYLIILLLIIVIKTVHPRLRIDQAVKFFWYFVTPVAVIGLVLSLAGV